MRKPFGSTKAPRQWFSNDLPLVCAPAVLPCAPCRAPTVRLCSAQGKALRKDARGTGWQRKESSEAPTFHKPLGVGRTGWQPVLLGKPSVVQRAACPLEGVCAKHSDNGKPNASPWVRAQGAHGTTVCTRSVFKTKALPNTGYAGVDDRWASRRTNPPCGSTGSAGRLAPPFISAPCTVGTYLY